MAARIPASSSVPGGNDHFGTTHWSVVLSAKDPTRDSGRASLEYLIETYWRPVYLYVRSQGRKHEDAKDLTQEFFARFLEKDFLRTVDRDKGRFRAFMLTALKRFLINEWASQHAQKRGGALKPLASLDVLKDGEAGRGWEPAKDETPEKAFNRNWARELLRRVFQRLEEVCTREGKKAYFEVLRMQFLEEKPDGRRFSYQEMAQRLQLDETDVTNYLHRAKGIYLDLLRQEIRSSVSSDAEVEEELRDLWGYLRDDEAARP